MTKTVFPLFLGILFVHSFLAVAGEVKTWKLHCAEAIKAINRRDMEQARTEYSLALQEAETFGEKDGRLVETLSQAATVSLDLRRYAEAEHLVKRAIDIKEKAVSLNRLDLPILLNQLGEIYLFAGQLDAAEENYLRSQKLAEPIVGKFHPLSGSIKAGLGRVAMRRKDTEKAIAYLQESLEIAEKPSTKTVVEWDAIVIYGRKVDEKNVGQLMNELGLAYSAAGKSDEAEKIFLRAIKKYEKTLGPDSPDLSAPLLNLTQIYLKQKRSNEAQSSFTRLEKIAQKNAAPTHPIWKDLEPLRLRVLLQTKPQEAVKKLNDLADAWFDEGRHSSIPALYEAIASVQGFEKDSQKFTRVSHQLGASYLEDGKFDLAELWERRALTMGEKAFASDEQALTAVYENLAEICAKTEKLEEAESLYRKTLALQEKKYGKESSEVTNTQNHLTDVMKKRNK